MGTGGTASRRSLRIPSPVRLEMMPAITEKVTAAGTPIGRTG
jgi:hypothetical protein